MHRDKTRLSERSASCQIEGTGVQQDIDLDRQKDRIREMITDAVSRTYAGDISKRYRQTEDPAERILRRIDIESDLRELRIAIDAVVRTDGILDTAPSFGRDEIVGIVDETLQTGADNLDPAKAYDALYNVDFDGKVYLGVQRKPFIDYVHEEMTEFQTDPDIDEREVARIISGIVQEYERRAAQNRGSTAGNVLETGLQYIFERFDIPAAGDPSHFGDLEVNNMVQGPEGSIGFSCKRAF